MGIETTPTIFFPRAFLRILSDTRAPFMWTVMAFRWVRGRSTSRTNFQGRRLTRKRLRREMAPGGSLVMRRVGNFAGGFASGFAGDFECCDTEDEKERAMRLLSFRQFNLAFQAISVLVA